MMSLNGRERNGNASRHKGDELNDVLLRIERDKHYPLQEVARMFNISRKTIDRCRKIGLESIEGEKRALYITGRAILEFDAKYPGKLERSMRFSRMSEEEKQQIINLARNEANAGKTHANICKFIADITDRSTETIRAILKNHDQEHPEQAIFERLASELVQSLAAAIQSGTPLQILAKRHNIPEIEMKKAIDQYQYEQLQKMQLEFMTADEFHHPDADNKILAEMPQLEKPARMPKVPKDLPAYLQELYRNPLLTAEQEVHLFRKYNYLKYKASLLLKGMDANRPSSRSLDKVASLIDRSTGVKNDILVANLRLVVAVMKKYVNNNQNDLYSLVSDGNMTLMRTIEKFDYTRGFKFSTYATWALKKNRSRDYRNEMKYVDRFRTGELDFDAFVNERSNKNHQEKWQRSAKSAVRIGMERLSDREKEVIANRFGLGDQQAPLTLKEVGKNFGISKERVRQIENRAMQKMKEALYEVENGECLEVLDEVCTLPEWPGQGRERRVARASAGK